ncbi:MAG TPA: hypothetical protein VFC82_03415 [Actinomycetaceae bacterium]|nr:hypothetical protein [Actinomycetaceae bacterium]
MSMSARATAPLQTPAPTTQRAPRLQVIRAPETNRSLLPFFLICAAILVAALVGALLLNTAMAVSSYRMHAQQVELTQLKERQAEMTASLESLGSPASLRDSAARIGMVPSEGTVYLSVASRSILGEAGGEG